MRRYLNPWTAVIAAVAVATISFLFIHQPIGRSLYVIVMSGEIWLGVRCNSLTNMQQTYPYTWWMHCGLTIPYRWVLALSVVVIAGALIERLRVR